MKRTLRGALIAAVSATYMTAAAPVQAETLTDALIAAYKNSDLLDQNRAVLRAADEDVAQAVSLLRPVFDFIARADRDDPVQTLGQSGGIRNSASLSVTADLLIYDGGGTRLAIDAAKENVLAARSGLIGVEQDVLLNTVSAYMDVRSALENVALGQSNVRLITQELRATRDRFEVGEVTRTDVSIAEAALAAARSALVAREGELAVAREFYKRAVGRYPSRLTGVPTIPRLPATVAEARAIAVRTHPDIQQAQHDVVVAELNVGRARAALRPQVRGGASVNRADGGDESTNVNIRLTQRLYQGGALDSAVRSAINSKEASRANLLNTVKLIEEQVGNAWSNVAVARAQIASSREQIRSARLAFDGTKEEAKLGSRTTLDVLDAEQDLLDAQATRITAEANQYVAIYSVLSSMGLLTVDHLNLGIPTYDPAAYYNAVKNAPSRSFQGKQLDRVLKSLGRE